MGMRRPFVRLQPFGKVASGFKVNPEHDVTGVRLNNCSKQQRVSDRQIHRLWPNVFLMGTADISARR